MFGHGSNLKLGSATGFAPAVTRSQGAGARPQCRSIDRGKLVSAERIALPVTRSQTGHVAATPRAVSPPCARSTPGAGFMGNAGPTHLEPGSRGKIWKLADSKGVAPSVAVGKHLPTDNGLLFYSATRAKVACQPKPVHCRAIRPAFARRVAAGEGWWEELVTLELSSGGIRRLPAA